MHSRHRQGTCESPTGIIIANDLRSGLTVFLTATAEWSLDVSEAQLVTDENSAHKALGIAAKDEADNRVTGAYLADCNEYGEPIELRESVRVLGPSVDYRSKINGSKSNLSKGAQSRPLKPVPNHAVMGEM